jgi:hypothetical protein
MHTIEREIDMRKAILRTAADPLPLWVPSASTINQIRAREHQLAAERERATPALALWAAVQTNAAPDQHARVQVDDAQPRRFEE